MNKTSLIFLIISYISKAALKKALRKSNLPHLEAYTDGVRNHVYVYFTRGEFSTVAKLQESLVDAGLYNGIIESLRTILKRMGFRFKKNYKRKIIMERHKRVLQRITFLREMKNITNWDNVIFVDETWLNANYTVPQIWTNDTAASCSKVPGGKGGRLIICHAGFAGGGFVENCLLAFQSKSTREYYEKMDAKIQSFITPLQNIPANSTIIMDNAPYHYVQIDKAPTQANKKADLVAWLQHKGVEADMKLLKTELIQLVKRNKPRKPLYVIDKLAEEHGHKVIRLPPPYHCQYNAIELIWAQIKGYAAWYNTKPPFTVKKMEGLVKKACAHVTKDDWAKVVEKTMKIIMDDFERDIHLDYNIANQIIINLNNDSSTSCSKK